MVSVCDVKGGPVASEPSFEQPVPTPLQAWLGLRWSLLPDETGIAVDMELRDDLRGPYGLLEGGVVTTLADVAGASAAARALGPWVATQAISMSFLAPWARGADPSRRHPATGRRTGRRVPGPDPRPRSRQPDDRRRARHRPVTRPTATGAVNARSACEL